MQLDPYRPPQAKVAEPPADKPRPGIGRIGVPLVVLAWLTPVAVSTAVATGLLKGEPTYVRWLGISVDLLAPAYGLCVPIPVCLLAMGEAVSRRRLDEHLLVPMLLSCVYGVATVGWYYMLWSLSP
jgi:hypothetical protein